MSVAIYIACETEIEGEDTFVDGKALGHVDPEVLERIEKNLSCRPIYDLMSQDAGELSEFLEDVGDDAIPAEQWFPAKEGLQTVRALRDYLLNDPASVPGSAEVIEDLVDFERVLTILDAHGVRFHFAMDF